MTKKETIQIVNKQLGQSILNGSNTNFSKINSSKNVWWLNIPSNRFSSDLHLLLLKGNGFIWIKIPKNLFSNLEKKFKIRPDKNVVDLEISSETNYMYMRDVKSGGSKLNPEPPDFTSRMYI